MPIRDPSLADLVRFFLADDKRDHRALTLARMEYITDNIADGRFIASTPAADAIYGRKMDGSQPAWISTTQPLDVFLKGRRMWAARQVDTSLPTQYLTDIVQPAGQILSVLKSTQEFDIDGVRYWLTVVSPASDQPDFPHICDIPVPIDGLPAIGMAGKLCIAEVVHELGLSENILTDPDPSGKLGFVKDKSIIAEPKPGPKVAPQTAPNLDVGASTQVISLARSSTGKRQRPHYLHTCRECEGAWVGTALNPPKCVFCGSRLWRGFSKWEARKHSKDLVP